MSTATAPFLAVGAEQLEHPRDYLRALGSLLSLVSTSQVEAAIARILACYRAGGTLFVFGNGGSAALASHMACDLGKGTVAAQRPRLRIVALTDNVPLLTALANDVSYAAVFAEQLRSLGSAADLALAISGSGNSPNVIAGLQAAREAGMAAIGLTGYHGGKMAAWCDPCVIVPCDNMQLLEDCHVALSHAIFLAVRSGIAANR